MILAQTETVTSISIISRSDKKTGERKHKAPVRT